MAAIDEGDKVRTIYDGSKGGANAHIQAHTREKTTAPTVLDGVQALHSLHHASATPRDVQPGPVKGTRWTAGSWNWPQPGAEWTLLKADVTKAHRRIKVLPEDWKYQVAEIDGEWWINKVGTYGMASAQLYWGRMAALLLRILYYAFPWLDWGFVFVDDFLWLLRREEAPLQATAILLLLLAMGTPLSWKKTVLSLSNIWLGFQVDPKGPVITMARDKHLIIQDLLNRAGEGGGLLQQSNREGAGPATVGHLLVPNDPGIPTTLLGMETGLQDGRKASQAGTGSRCPSAAALGKEIHTIQPLHAGKQMVGRK